MFLSMQVEILHFLMTRFANDLPKMIGKRDGSNLFNSIGCLPVNTITTVLEHIPPDDHMTYIMSTHPTTGYNLLMWLIEENNVEVFSWLLDFVEKEDWLVIVSAKNTSGMTCLHMVAYRGRCDMYKMIIDSLTANDVISLLSERDSGECIVLHYASTERLMAEAVISTISSTELLSQLNAVNRFGWTSLHIACAYADLETVTFILAQIKDEKSRLDYIRKTTPENCTSLHLAAQRTAKDKMMAVLSSYFSDKAALRSFTSMTNINGDTAGQIATSQETKIKGGMSFGWVK